MRNSPITLAKSLLPAALGIAALFICRCGMRRNHGFWDVSYDWGGHSVKFNDGREFDYKNWKWSGAAGPTR